MRTLACYVLVSFALVCHPLAAEDDVGLQEDPAYDAEQAEVEADDGDETEGWGIEIGEDATDDWGQAPDVVGEEEEEADTETDQSLTGDWPAAPEPSPEFEAESGVEPIQGEDRAQDLNPTGDPPARTAESDPSTHPNSKPASSAPSAPATGEVETEASGTLGERVSAITRELDAELAAMAGRDAPPRSQARLGEINQRLNQAIDWVNQAAERGQLKEARDASLPLATGCQQWKPQLESALGASNEGSQQTQLREAIDYCEQIIEARHKLPN